MYLCFGVFFFTFKPMILEELVSHCFLTSPSIINTIITIQLPILYIWFTDIHCTLYIYNWLKSWFGSCPRFAYPNLYFFQLHVLNNKANFSSGCIQRFLFNSIYFIRCLSWLKIIFTGVFLTKMNLLFFYKKTQYCS